MASFIKTWTRNSRLVLVIISLGTATLIACDDTSTEGGKCSCKDANTAALYSPKDYCRNSIDDNGKPVSFISTVAHSAEEKTITEFHSGQDCQGPIIDVKTR